MMKFIVVGYAECGDWYLIDEDGKQVEFETVTVKNDEQLLARFGLKP